MSENNLPHYRDCQAIRAAAVRVGSFGGVQASHVQIAYDQSVVEPQPHFNTLTELCPYPTNAISPPVALSLGDRVLVRVTTRFETIVPLVNIPSINVSSITSRTYLSGIDVRGTPRPTLTKIATYTYTISPTPTLDLTATQAAIETSIAETQVFAQTQTAQIGAPLTETAAYELTGTAAYILTETADSWTPIPIDYTPPPPTDTPPPTPEDTGTPTLTPTPTSTPTATRTATETPSADCSLYKMDSPQVSNPYTGVYTFSVRVYNASTLPAYTRDVSATWDDTNMLLTHVEFVRIIDLNALGYSSPYFNDFLIGTGPILYFGPTFFERIFFTFKGELSQWPSIEIGFENNCNVKYIAPAFTATPLPTATRKNQ
jgi:hypothetical protein